MVEWNDKDGRDDENNWLLEGRTILIFKGGDRKDPATFRQIACLQTITKTVTLAIHARMKRAVLDVEMSSVECEQRGVRTSQRCKETVIENISNATKRKEKMKLPSCTTTSRRRIQREPRLSGEASECLRIPAWHPDGHR